MPISFDPSAPGKPKLLTIRFHREESCGAVVAMPSSSIGPTQNVLCRCSVYLAKEAGPFAGPLTYSARCLFVIDFVVLETVLH
jgi:hypothetical protein